MVDLSLKGQLPDDTTLCYTVIIPAYNEESFLPATLTQLQQAMQAIPQRGEIIVVNNNSTDNTEQIALEHGVRIVFEPFRHIAKARNAGAKAATSPFLVFLDADTILPTPLLQKAINLLENGKYCGGGTLLRFDSELPFLAAKLVRFWNWFSQTGKLAAGSFIFCLENGFVEIGGFDEKVYAGEEIFFSRRIKAWGKNNNLLFTILRDHPVITSSRKFQWYSSLQIALLLLLFTVFPFALRSRSLCRFWYARPRKS